MDDENKTNITAGKSLKKLSADKLSGKLNHYLEQKTAFINKEYKHNYIGNVKIHLRDGFNIKNI